MPDSVHILRKHKPSDSENLTLGEMRKTMTPCPICGKKAFLSHYIVDGFDFGFMAGCPAYCLDDGVHGITDMNDPRAPRVTGYSAEQVYRKWNAYCKKMEVATDGT